MALPFHDFESFYWWGFWVNFWVSLVIFVIGLLMDLFFQQLFGSTRPHDSNWEDADAIEGVILVIPVAVHLFVWPLTWLLFIALIITLSVKAEREERAKKAAQQTP